MDLLTASEKLLRDVGFSTKRVSANAREALAFENATIIGFIHAYTGPADLLANWAADERRLIAEYQLALRRAGQKAWNLYTVLLASELDDGSHLSQLTAIEENLVATRKVARSGVRDSTDLRDALLPLLPLQAAPRLEAVDLAQEIRQRTTELKQRAMDAFLSGTDENAVLQVLEEEQ